MRTSRKVSRLGPLVLGRRAARAWLLAGLVLGLVLGLGGCDAGGGGESATRPTTDRSGTRPAPSVTELPSVTVTAPTRSTRTSATTPAWTQTPTSAEPPTSPTRTPTSAEALPTSTSTPSAAGAPAAAEDGGSSLLRELVAAVDAENEALATGRDWRLLRPRVDEAGRALSAVLAGVPQQEPPAGGAPW